MPALISNQACRISRGFFVLYQDMVNSFYHAEKQSPAPGEHNISCSFWSRMKSCLEREIEIDCEE